MQTIVVDCKGDLADILVSQNFDEATAWEIVDLYDVPNLPTVNDIKFYRKNETLVLRRANQEIHITEFENTKEDLLQWRVDIKS